MTGAGRGGPRRILYVNPAGGLGGAERVLLNVLAALRQARPETELCLMALAPGPLLEHAHKLGARVQCLPLPDELSQLGDSRLRDPGPGGKVLSLLAQSLTAIPAAWDYVGRLRRHIDALRPTLIHSNGVKAHLLLGLAGLRRPPVLWHVHDFLTARPVVRRLVPWAGRGVAGLLAISQAVARDVASLLPRPPLWVVQNTVDLERFSPGEPDGAWLDALAGLPPARPGTLRVGLVATYARWKGHDLFLRTAAQLLAQAPPAPLRFYVVGSPIYDTRGSQFSEAELRTLARGPWSENEIGFVPFQEDPARAYRALDLVVHASTRPEPFGLTILEAMACRRPVIAVQAGGAAELFRDGHDAVGIPLGDAAALAAALRGLAADPARRRALAENARCTAAAHFGTERLGPQMSAVYDALCGPGVARRGRSASSLACSLR